MKKYVLALTAALLPTGSYSHGLGTGFYLGAHTGYMNTSGKAELPALHGSADLGRHRPHVGAFLGYGYMQNCIYSGFELGYGFEPNSFRFKIGDVHETLKRNHNFLATLRLGVLFTPTTLFYIRAGGNLAKYKVVSNDKKTFSKSRFSPVVGVGLDAATPALGQNTFIRTEWTYDFGHRLGDIKKLHTQKFTLGIGCKL